MAMVDGEHPRREKPQQQRDAATSRSNDLKYPSGSQITLEYSLGTPQ